MIPAKNVVCARKKGERDFVPYSLNVDGTSIINLITGEVTNIDLNLDRIFVEGDYGRSVWTYEIWTKHKGVEEKISNALGGDYEVKSLLQALKLVEHTRFYKKLDYEIYSRVAMGCIEGIRVMRFGDNNFLLHDREITALVKSINKNIDKEEKYQNKYAKKQNLKNLFKKKKQIDKDIDIEEESQEFR